MQIIYCDLCSSPIKENNFFMFYVCEPKNTYYDELNYYENLRKVQKEVKEICPSCKHIFDRIFELRLQRLSELSNELLGVYNLPSKKNPKERDNDQEKK